MKIWVDDLREPPSSWWWVKTSAAAIDLLADCRVRGIPVELLSLDHDLGGVDTTRPVVLWMCENDMWPTTVKCHSMNPVGREWIEGTVKRYKPATSITCPLCGKTSHNPNDVRERYCGSCHKYVGDQGAGPAVR